MSDLASTITPLRKALITASVMGTTLVVALDATIANVALPHMQASLSAAPDQIVWVLTSYLIASAIMMPLSSWLASRFGRKLVMTLSVALFTVSSLACGMARSLEFMVLARVVQGVSGAGLIPLGQAVLLDINPREKQPAALAMAGVGAMLGPLLGPTLGGWLTDNYSWRWVFLINLPIGLAVTFMTALCHIEARDRNMPRFDMMGFVAVSLFIGTFQLMMDRGQQNDWFDSLEICIEAGIVALSFYLTVVHMLTRKDTFVRAEVFRDLNFTLGCLVSAVVGVVIFAAMPIQTIMTQTLLGYSPLKNGLVNLPRAIGTTMMLLAVTRLIGRIDARVLLMTGLACAIASFYVLSRLSLETDEMPVLLAGFLQGVAGGLMIAPLSALTFATLAPGYRNEGAAIYALTRNLGNAVGISVIQLITIRQSAQVASRLAEEVRPDVPGIGLARPEIDLTSTEGLLRASGELWRQATMVATVDAFWAAGLIAIATIPIVLLMRSPRFGKAEPLIDPGH